MKGQEKRGEGRECWGGGGGGGGGRTRVRVRAGKERRRKKRETDRGSRKVDRKRTKRENMIVGG